MRGRKSGKQRLLSLLLVMVLTCSSFGMVQAADVNENASSSQTMKAGGGDSEALGGQITEGTGTGTDDENGNANGDSLTEDSTSQSGQSGTQSGASSGEQPSSGSSSGASASGPNNAESSNVAAPSTTAVMSLDNSGNVDAQSDTQATGLGATVTLQIEGYGYTLEEGASVTMPDTYKTFADYGLTGLSEPATPGYTILHVLAQYCVDSGVEPSDMMEVNYGYVAGFMGLPEKSAMMFLLNRQALMVGAGEQKIQEGDLISVADLWFNSNWTSGGFYAWFTQNTASVPAEENVTLNLNTVDTMSGAAGDASGATVQVYDENEELVAETTTGSNGSATFSIDEPGNYTVTAERKSIYYDDNWNHPYDITRPHCKLTVTPARTMTDEEVVAMVKDSLDLGDVSAVTANLELPVKGNKGAVISWKTSDAAVVSDTGKITRPTGKNLTATLTATITKNKTIETKEFPITVKGYSLKLKSLSVAEGTLNFEQGKEYYTVYVSEDVDKINVTAETEEEWPTVFLYINGNFISDGKNAVKFPLEKGSMEIPVKVSKGSMESFTYITVKRAASLGNPLEDLPDNDWGQHLGDANNNAVVSAETPTKNGSLIWESFSNGADSWGSIYAGTPILVNKTIYAVRNQKLQALDASTGKVKMSADLLGDIGYYSNITYGGGMIFVPLGDGRIQCFNGATFTSMFVTEKPGDPILGGYNIYGSIHYDNGVIYVGYTDGSAKGYFAAFDTVDTNVNSPQEIVSAKWTNKETRDVSYYGTGGATVGNYIVFAGDDGVVSVVDTRNGKETGNCKLQGKARGSVVYADGYIWAATQDYSVKENNKIYKLSVNTAGAVEIAASTEIPLPTNASPVVSGGKVYLTGGTFNDGGFLAVYDMNLTELATQKFAGAANTPTLTTSYDDVYLYFTQNAEEGAVCVARITGNNKITVEKLYQPTHQNYSMSTVVVGADGTIYYGNDSGYLFAIGKSAATPAPDPTPNPAPTPKPTPTPAGGASGQQSPQTPTGYALQPTTRRSGNAITTDKKAAEETTNKSTSETIAETVLANVDEGKKSLTIKNAPDTLEKEVFAELAKHPEFQLVLDCGTYTLSIKGSDVTNPEASLSTKLIEKEDNLSKKEKETLGEYQVLELVQEGALPGKVTVVYQLPEQLKEASQLYLYQMTDLKTGTEVVIQKAYAMFSLSKAGQYVLAENDGNIEQETETVKTAKTSEDQAIPTNLMTEDAQPKGMPIWLIALIAVAGGAVAGGVATGIVLNGKRKKEDTWEQ